MTNTEYRAAMARAEGEALDALIRDRAETWAAFEAADHAYAEAASRPRPDRTEIERIRAERSRLARALGLESG